MNYGLGGCGAPGVCPNGFTLTVVEQDVVPIGSGATASFGTCPGYDCINAQHQSYRSILMQQSPCNQKLLFVQPVNLLYEAAALGCLLLLPGIAKLLVVVPVGLFLVSNISSRMDYDAYGKCVVMSSGL